MSYVCGCVRVAAPFLCDACEERTDKAGDTGNRHRLSYSKPGLGGVEGHSSSHERGAYVSLRSGEGSARARSIGMGGSVSHEERVSTVLEAGTRAPKGLEDSKRGEVWDSLHQFFEHFCDVRE